MENLAIEKRERELHFEGRSLESYKSRKLVLSHLFRCSRLKEIRLSESESEAAVATTTTIQRQGERATCFALPFAFDSRPHLLLIEH